MIFQRHLGASFAVGFLMTMTQAYKPVTFSMTSQTGGCGGGYLKAVTLSDGNCHSVESFNQGFGGIGDIGVRSIDVYQVSGDQPLVAFSDHNCNDPMFTISGAGCENLQGGAYSFALSDSTNSAATTGTQRSRRDTDYKPPFKNGKTYLFGGITFIIANVVVERNYDTFFPIQGSAQAYDETVRNAWTNQQAGDTAVVVGGQETGFVILDNPNYGQAPANGMGVIAADAAQAAVGLTSISYEVKRGGNVIAEIALTGDVN